MFTLEFDTDNNIFDGHLNSKREIKRILNQIAYEVFLGKYQGDVTLTNGETIGKYKFVE